MDDLRYILQEPIELEGIGVLYPLNILEFSKNSHIFSILSVTKNTLLQQVSVKDKEKRDYIENNVKNFDVVTSQPDLILMLAKLFMICFRLNAEDIQVGQEENGNIYFLLKGNRVDRNNYDYVRNQIIKINNIHLPKQAKNAELQKWFDKAKKAKSRTNNTDMEDIITTIVALTGITFDEIKKMTIYQINKLIERINKIKEYDANIKFICAGAKDVKIDSYLAHLSDDNEEKLSISLDELRKSMGNAIDFK